MSAPAVKFPPPLLYLGAILAGGLLDHFLPIPGIAVSSAILKPLGSVLFLAGVAVNLAALMQFRRRSEEHTSELQSRSDLVCRLLLENKNRE